jgi:hypothetical protein
MPLRDHFHSPLKSQRHWEGFHSAWANTIVRHLTRQLPPRYFAEPQIHLGVHVEADVATFESETSAIDAEGTGNGIATAVSAPPQPPRTFAVDFPAQDVFEVRLYDEERESRLVAVLELVSPGNKDRPETRHAFTIKCAAYLQQQVALMVVDIVADRQADLYAQLLELLRIADDNSGSEKLNLHAAAYRIAKEDSRWRLDAWPERLRIGAALPTLPLWLASNFSLLVNLEATYEETCQVLRIR